MRELLSTEEALILALDENPIFYFDEYDREFVIIDTLYDYNDMILDNVNTQFWSDIVEK